MVEGKSAKRQHNRVVKSAGFGAKQLDLYPSFATFQLRLSFFTCKTGIKLTLV